MLSHFKAPHTAGAFALIIAAHPTWGFNEAYNALAANAVHPPLADADKNCGLPTPNDFPNYVYGKNYVHAYIQNGINNCGVESSVHLCIFVFQAMVELMLLLHLDFELDTKNFPLVGPF